LCCKFVFSDFIYLKCENIFSSASDTLRSDNSGFNYISYSSEMKVLICRKIYIIGVSGSGRFADLAVFLAEHCLLEPRIGVLLREIPVIPNDIKLSSPDTQASWQFLCKVQNVIAS
jgi:hypothetical protein